MGTIFSTGTRRISHGNNTIAYFVEAHDLGQGGWTDADMAKFVTLFDKIV